MHPCPMDTYLVNVTVCFVCQEFQCHEGSDVDNLVFAGLKNGQVRLLFVVVFFDNTFHMPVEDWMNFKIYTWQLVNVNH